MPICAAGRPRPMFGQDRGLVPRLTKTCKVAGDPDSRLPPYGSFLERDYKGRPVIVKVLVGGFEFEGRLYRSRSATASEVTGTKWNGFLFFGCTSNNGGADEKR